ncbi:MAG: TetR/AcrR family transcriptional regulator, partial [Candidatus Binatia bacterium]
AHHQERRHPAGRKAGASRSIRRRRSVDEARRAILAAAERRLVRGGAEAVRLEDVAGDVGMSRPAVLYHFGSRQGLLRALMHHAIEGMQQDLIRVLATPGRADTRLSRSERTFQTLERIADVFDRRGHARMVAGLILSGRDLKKSVAGTGVAFAQVVHALRSQRRAERGGEAADFEDSLSGLTLIFVALFGDALVGALARLAFGLAGDDGGARRFRRWFAELIEAYEPPPRGRRPGARRRGS